MKKLLAILLAMLLCFTLLACEDARDEDEEEEETTAETEAVDLIEAYSVFSQLGFEYTGKCNFCGADIEAGYLCSDCVDNNENCIVCREDLYSGETLICASCLNDLNNSGGKVTGLDSIEDKYGDEIDDLIGDMDW